MCEKREREREREKMLTEKEKDRAEESLLLLGGIYLVALAE